MNNDQLEHCLKLLMNGDPPPPMTDEEMRQFKWWMTRCLIKELAYKVLKCGAVALILWMAFLWITV